MALIYQKTPDDRVLVLGVREALLYPFDLGNDWQELRLGLLYALVSATDPAESAPPDETIVSPTVRSNAWYWGFKDQAQALPGNPGGDFVGCWAPLGGGSRPAVSGIAGNTIVTGQFNAEAAPSTCLLGSITGGADAGVPQSAAADGAYDQPFLRSPTANVGAAGQYCALSVMQLLYTAQGQLTVACESTPTNNPTGLTPPTIELLRQLMRASSFPFTSGPVSRARPPALGAFFYLPFANTRLRISALCVERYA